MRFLSIGCVCLGAMLSLYAESDEYTKLKERADAGDAFAQFELGKSCDAGELGFPHDPDLGDEWFAKSIPGLKVLAESGNTEAMFNLGNCYEFAWGCKKDTIEAAKYYQFAGDAGHALAYLYLSGNYRTGDTFPKDDAKALDYIQKSAALGCADAYRVLARYYLDEGKYNNETLSQEYWKKAFDIYQREAAQGNLDSLAYTGIYFMNGFGVAKDTTKGLQLLQEAAEKQSLFAQEVLAEIYGEGLVEDKSFIDYEKAKFWYAELTKQCSTQELLNSRNHFSSNDTKSEEMRDFINDLILERGSADAQFDYWRNSPEGDKKGLEYLKKAAEAGHIDAMIRLAYLYENGDGVEVNKEKARELRQQVLSVYVKKAEAGDVKDILKVAEFYIYFLDDKKSALEWYLKAIENGDASAQHALGNAYQNGSVGDINFTEAIVWYRKSAEQGYVKAQASLGSVLMNGDAAEQREAVVWLMKAANSNKEDTYTFRNLGKCYENGIGVEMDYVDAFDWYRKAANESGNWPDSYALYRLAHFYENGLGTAINPAKAEEYYWKAAEHGNSEAQEKLGYSFRFYKAKNYAKDVLTDWVF